MMKKLILLFLFFAATMAAISYSGLDIKTASLFYNPAAPTGWPDYNLPLWNFLYHQGTKVPILIGIVALLVFILSFIYKIFKPWRMKTLFAVLLIIIAPLIVVQSLKNTWGRPRPGEIVQFGGKYEYRTPFEPNFKLVGKADDGKSFPSGHAATAFYIVALYFIFRKKWLLALSLGYGGLMGLCRMVQGGHFLTDVLGSFFIVYITAEILAHFLLRVDINKNI
jgi:lipid A 4'-phosphatase